MAQSFPNFISEVSSAATGCIRLVRFKRDAAQYFDYSQQGLVGSLIAVAIAILIAGFGQLAFGHALRPGMPTITVMMNTALFVGQAVTAWLVLRQMGRPDGFVPYMVASNWVTLFSGVILWLSTLFGEAGALIMFPVAIAAVITFINIGRFIVTLKPAQIVLLFISQAVAVFFVMGVMALILPVPGAH